MSSWNISILQYSGSIESRSFLGSPGCVFANRLFHRQLYLFRESLVVFALNDFKMLGLLLPFLLVAHGVSALNLSLAQAYAGQTFFDDWTFNASLAVL